MTAALNNIKAVQTELDKAIALLQNKENNDALVQAKQRLEQIVNEADPTQGMTTDTANSYKSKNVKLKLKYKRLNKSLTMAMPLNNKLLTKQIV